MYNNLSLYSFNINIIIILFKKYISRFYHILDI
jgi:hypothetical protein